ncbi:hypothetical protein AAG570_012300 [Ranatra chinensis]|uniref:Uncharacterized protein n=1 Tax=Ranatra chinensis TaxID=642074 RepID=A0ABD0Z4P8_9HEMI
MASKRRITFYENKKQETTEIGTRNLPSFCDLGQVGLRKRVRPIDLSPLSDISIALPPVVLRRQPTATSGPPRWRNRPPPPPPLIRQSAISLPPRLVAELREDVPGLGPGGFLLGVGLLAVGGGGGGRAGGGGGRGGGGRASCRVVRVRAQRPRVGHPVPDVRVQVRARVAPV